MPGSILGNAVRRVEDPAILFGHAQYVDDLPIEGVLHLAFVRSTVAHGRINSIETSDAAAMPGVAGVFTAADLDLPAHHAFMVLNPACARPPLAVDKVRFVGEPVAVVAATTRAAAIDATEAVIVDIDPLPAAIDPEFALSDGAPLQFEELGSNLAAGMQGSDDDDPLASAEVVVRGRFENQRIAVVPMEGNAIAVVPGAADDEFVFTAYVSTQMPHAWRRIAGETLGIEQEKIRVVAPHVGGAFGAKAGLQSEHTVAVGVARVLQRPVKWVETRSENMVATPHGRGQVQYIEAGFDREGAITGVRCRVVGDAGAYAGFGGALAIGPTRMMAQGVYRVPQLRYDVAAALTNTTPMGAFRGAGRPEAAAMLERLMDLAAAELRIDPVELRRRNLLSPDVFPYKTITGVQYDSGNYQRALDEAVRLAGYDDARKEQAERRARGERKVLGIGVSVYVEITAGGGSSEYASLTINDDGTATITVGTSGHGQGHATSFAMIVADRLGIPVESVQLIQSDTAVIPRGGGTGGSRSLQIGGSAVAGASDAVLDRARAIAADRLEAAVDDIVVNDDGKVGVAGVPARALTWAELSAEAGARDEPLHAALDFEQDAPTFPFGAHVAIVEVDLDTGAVAVQRHIAVDDCGRILNPLIVTGQQHGGIAQGIAQALWEQFVYDADGNPLTTTLADYAMPSAAELPSFEAANTETPSPLNPLGAKGIGESGTIGSTPAVHNAVIDALSHLGVRHIDMPCTPERVWRAVNDAEVGHPTDPWREPPAFFAQLPVRGRSREEPEAASADI